MTGEIEIIGVKIWNNKRCNPWEVPQEALLSTHEKQLLDNTPDQKHQRNSYAYSVGFPVQEIHAQHTNQADVHEHSSNTHISTLEHDMICQESVRP